MRLKKLWVGLGLLVTLGMLLNFIGCGKGTCTPRIPGDRRITMSYLGTQGRFGNHIYEYIFLKAYAKRHSLEVETPEWAGTRLFGLQDPRVSADFCEVNEVKEPNLLRSYNLEVSTVYANRDLKGDFQIHTSHHKRDKQFIQDLLQPVPQLKAVLQPVVDQLKAGPSTLVVIHLRRGDFGSPPYIVAPSAWYLDWLKKNWDTWTNPVLYIASDEVDKVIDAFSQYHPRSIKDFQVTLPVAGADFYPDYFVMTQADVLAISNSTFSTSAALLNRTGHGFFRPSFSDQTLVEFDPWATTPFEDWHK